MTTTTALTNMDPDQLLTIAEVAGLLGCSKPHVYSLLKKGAISGVDISEPESVRSKMRVRREHLRGYIESNTWKADPPDQT